MSIAFSFGRLQRLLRDKLWLPPAFASIFAILVATAAYVLGQQYEGRIGLQIGKEGLVSLLGVLASGMLTVATFTITSIITSATSAANLTTPRASRLVVSDPTAQFVLSAFIAAFIYSVVGIIALNAFPYGPAGRFILFGGLIVIVALVLVSFINWVDRATKLGRQGTVIDILRGAALDSLKPLNVGTLGARVHDGLAPPNAHAVYPAAVGYVVTIDIAPVQAFCEEHDCRVFYLTRPGELVAPAQPIAYITGSVSADDEACALIFDAIEINRSRVHDCDIRHNILNLTETADRALSPAVNDPGTAIIILNIMIEVLTRWSLVRREPNAVDVKFDRVAMPELTARELFNDAFTPIARDGAGHVEVAVRLQNVLRTLARLGDGPLTLEVLRLSSDALELAESKLTAVQHRERVAEAARKVREEAAEAANRPPPDLSAYARTDGVK
jgi:uncharacterized membrane protein